METLAYENVFLIKNNIENSYGQALGFANSLRNISALPVFPTVEGSLVSSNIVRSSASKVMWKYMATMYFH